MPREIDAAEYCFRHGDVWFQSNSHDHRVCGPSDFLAVAFDPEEGILYKHGSEALVQKWVDNAREKFSKIRDPDFQQELSMLSFPVHEETIAELNACIATSGRVKHLEKRLTEMAERLPTPVRFPG